MKVEDIPPAIRAQVQGGTVIPAHPLALKEDRTLDARSMRALTRYYIDAGAGGIAVGVHSTQFEIRDEGINLLEPVLRKTAETIDDWAFRKNRSICKIAGVCGRTDQAIAEVELAHGLGYHACLLSLAAFPDDDIFTLIKHCSRVGEVMPIIGFYLQPAVGGRTLPYDFWRQFARIDNVLAIKIAPFNRYQTLDVIRGVCDAGREEEIALYTGNDDNIVADLLTPFSLRTYPETGQNVSHGQAGMKHRVVLESARKTMEGKKTVRIRGGLLGHWSVWTRKAVELLQEIHAVLADGPIPPGLLARGVQVTDANAAFFDSANSFAGCIPGIHEVLRRQGLMPGTWCLNPNLRLSPGQKKEIDRVYEDYPHLNDDAFVQAHLSEWLES